MVQRTRSDISTASSVHDSAPQHQQSPRRTPTSSKSLSQKLHIITLVVCITIICITRYQKAIHVIDSSSFYQEDKSFHPPKEQRQEQQQQLWVDDQQEGRQISRSNRFFNKKYNSTFNDDDYPPPREIIKSSISAVRRNNRKNDEEDDDVPIEESNNQEQLKEQYRQQLSERQNQQQQNTITAQRLKSISKFKGAAALSTTSFESTKPKKTNIKPQYEFVDGKKTLVYKRLYPRVLYFVHIHKSAGTLICSYAYHNRLSSEHMRNCNVQDDQRCCGGEDTIDAQIAFANSTYYDFVAIEREMYDSMAPDYYDYIACIRNSKARYFSHWGHLRRLVPGDLRKRTGGYGTAGWIMNDTSAAYAATPDGGDSSSPGKKKSITDLPNILYNVATASSSQNHARNKDPLGSFQMWYRHQPDNWNTRIFCGPKCMSKPQYQIPLELFQYTLERLDKFRHFIFVENITESFNTMATYYGWKTKHEDTYVRNQRHDHIEAKQKLQKQIWDYKMSALDDAIYEFAQRKYNNASQDVIWSKFSNQQELDTYFAEGPTNGCTNACCGECSLY